VIVCYPNAQKFSSCHGPWDKNLCWLAVAPVHLLYLWASLTLEAAEWRIPEAGGVPGAVGRLQYKYISVCPVDCRLLNHVNTSIHTHTHTHTYNMAAVRKSSLAFGFMTMIRHANSGMEINHKRNGTLCVKFFCKSTIEKLATVWNYIRRIQGK
jgi:hypothetical protein